MNLAQWQNCSRFSAIIVVHDDTPEASRLSFDESGDEHASI